MRNCIVPATRNRTDFDSLIDSFFGGTLFPKSSSFISSDFAPRVNVEETADKLNMTIELPGMDKGDIKILVQDNTLTISGERKIQNEIKTENIIRSEIHTGSFRRSFSLPDYIDSASVDAEYKNGLLNISILKKEERKPKEIDVKVS